MRWNVCENKKEDIPYYKDSIAKLIKIQHIVDEVQLVEYSINSSLSTLSNCYKAIKQIKEVLGSED